MRAAVLDQRLEAIAGPPVAQRDHAGETSVSLADLPALAGRTIYVVVDRLQADPPAGPHVFARAHPDTADATAQLRIGEVTGGWVIRPQFAAGGGAGASYGTGVIVAGVARRVMMVRLVDGLSSLIVSCGGSSASRTGMAAGEGWPQPQVRLETPTSHAAGVWMGMWRGAHTWAQAARIHRWLAARYQADGTPPPPF